MAEPYFPPVLSTAARDAYDSVSGSWSPARVIGVRESSLLALARHGLVEIRANPPARELQFRLPDTEEQGPSAS